MSSPTAAHVVTRALMVAGISALALAGCSAAPSGSGSAGTESSGTGSTDGAPTAEVGTERPEGLDESLPVPPGVLISATPITSSWEYIYGEITDQEARDLADGLLDSGFNLLVTVDSDGVEQWYMQSDDWAIKLEQTHATETLYYAVDVISE